MIRKSSKLSIKYNKETKDSELKNKFIFEEHNPKLKDKMI